MYLADDYVANVFNIFQSAIQLANILKILTQTIATEKQSIKFQLETSG